MPMDMRWDRIKEGAAEMREWRLMLWKVTEPSWEDARFEVKKAVIKAWLEEDPEYAAFMNRPYGEFWVTWERLLPADDVWRRRDDANVLAIKAFGFDEHLLHMIISWVDFAVSSSCCPAPVLQSFLVNLFTTYEVGFAGVTEDQWRQECSRSCADTECCDGGQCQTCGVRCALVPAAIGVVKIPLRRKLAHLPNNDDLIKIIDDDMEIEERQVCEECSTILGM